MLPWRDKNGWHKSGATKTRFVCSCSLDARDKPFIFPGTPKHVVVNLFPYLNKSISESLFKNYSLNHHIKSHLSKNRFLYFIAFNSFSISCMYFRELSSLNIFS